MASMIYKKGRFRKSNNSLIQIQIGKRGNKDMYNSWKSNQKLFDWFRDICPTREVSKEDFSSKTYFTKKKFINFFRILSRINTVFF